MLPGVLLLGFAFFPISLGSQICHCTCLAEQAKKGLQMPSRQTRQLRHIHQPRQRHRRRGSKAHSEEFIPQIIDHPSDLVVRWDQPATLNCRAIGNPVPIIEWFRNGELVTTNKDDATSHLTLLPDGALFFLRLNQKKGKSDEGVYNCVARNHLGVAVSKNASLYVAVLQEDFQLHPSDLVVVTGEQLMLECLPPRGYPEPIISWKKNGVPINQENGRYEVSSSHLLVAHALKSDSGAYVCVATNQAGERASRAAVVSVLEKPTFTRRPNDVVASIGSTIQFMCGIHGDPTPVIQWHKEFGELPSGRYEISQENTLQIHRLTMYDAGKFICTGENQVGTISAKASLTVQDPLDTGQKEQESPENVLKELKEVRVFLANVTAIPSTSAANLHWKVIPSSLPIEGFKVFYRSLLPVSTQWAQWNVPKDHRAIVPGLERGYKYEFKVQPYSGKVFGSESNVKHLWVPEEVPSAAPQSISITIFQGGNGTVIIHWEPPPSDTHNGLIKSYQIWFLGNETHNGSNRTVDGGTHSFETAGLANKRKYCVQIAAVNGAGTGVASNPVCSTIEPTVEKMVTTSDILSTNYILKTMREPVFIASLGSALWILLMVLAIYVCHQHAKQYRRGRQYAMGEGLYRNASEDTIIKHRIDSSDSPWLSNTWKSTSGSKNYSSSNSSSSLSSQLLWTEPKGSQDLHKSMSFDRQSQESHIQAVPLVPGSNNPFYGALYVDLPVKDLKTFSNIRLPHLSNPNLHSVELAQPGEDQKLMARFSQNLRTDNANARRETQQGPWKPPGSLSPNLVLQESWDKNRKKELQKAQSNPMPPTGFLTDGSNHESQASDNRSGKHNRIHGEMKKVLKTYSSPRFLQRSTSQNVTALLPPPPPLPPGFQVSQDLSTKQECTCTCYLKPPLDSVAEHQDKLSLQTDSGLLEEHQDSPTLPYSHLSSASISVSLSDDTETVLTPEEVAEYLELSEEVECQRPQHDSISATPRVFSTPHTYGYICGPLASELLEADAAAEDDDDLITEEGGCHSTKFFRSFCRIPSSSLSEDEASLSGSLFNGWGSVSEDNGTSTRCSLISSSDSSFLMDASFAQALAVAVDSFCFGLTPKEVDRAFADVLPSASSVDGIQPPPAFLESHEEAQWKPRSQMLPVWEWTTDWVDEMEAKYTPHAESWSSTPESRGGQTVLRETQQHPSSLRGSKGACMSDSIGYRDGAVGALRVPLANPQDPGSGAFAISKREDESIMEKPAIQRRKGEKAAIEKLAIDGTG